MQNVLISVIMPVYNSGKYLDQAVNSVLSQDFEDFELILVDDGSTDGSDLKCDTYAQVDPRVMVIHKQNGGICNARNIALSKAKGVFIAFADHDDVYKPGLLKKTYESALLNSSDIVKFSKEYKLIKDDVVQREWTDVIRDRIIDKSQYPEVVCELITEWALDCVWDGLYRRSIISRNDIQFDERFKKGGEDIAFNIKFLLHSDRMTTLSGAYYTHYVRKGFSTSSKYNSNGIHDQVLLTDIVVNGLKEMNVDFYKNKQWFTYYLMRNYICVISAILSSPNCTFSNAERNLILKNCLNESFIPDFFMSVNVLDVARFSRKIALAYFFVRHNMFKCLYTLFNLRRILPSLKID